MADWAYFSNAIPGSKMCCICFDYVLFADLYIDGNGVKWDMCVACGEDSAKGEPQ